MNIIAAAGPHISIAPDTLFHIGPIAITNAQILGVIGGGILLWILLATVRAAIMCSGSMSLAINNPIIHNIFYIE